MKWLIRTVAVLFVLTAAAGAALLLRPAPVAPPPASVSEGEPLGQFTPLAAKPPAPALAFTTVRGAPKSLADFRGQMVLVNLWATWCGPCVEEMPSLDRLQAKLGGKLTVLAISEDHNAAAAVDPFLAKHAIKTLSPYLDAKDEALQAFAVRGLPTSILIDRDGAILGKLEGAADWDSPKMIALLQRYGVAP